MAIFRKVHRYLVIAAAVATILGLLLAVFSTFFPAKLNELTSNIAGPVDRSPTGTVRADYVRSQVKVFLYVSALVVLLTGASIGMAYHLSSAASAGSVAAGRGKIRWLKFVTISCPVVLAVWLGVYLPLVVFQPTNEEELGRQLFLGAWAVRSIVGGVVLGLTYLALAALVAYLGFVLFVQLRRSVLLSKYQRQLES